MDLLLRVFRRKFSKRDQEYYFHEDKNLVKNKAKEKLESKPKVEEKKNKLPPPNKKTKQEPKVEKRK